MEHIWTVDWFTHNTNNFNDSKKRLKNRVDRILEIGSFEGRGTCWMLENMLSDTGTITCIDPFVRDDDPNLQARFNYNTGISKKPGQTVNVIPATSYAGLAYLINNRHEFDFIYVDGDHCTDSVMTDACMAWGLLRNSGIMMFDDYFWDHVPDHLDRPKMGIDAFINAFIKRLEVVTVGYQVAVQKLPLEKE